MRKVAELQRVVYVRNASSKLFELVFTNPWLSLLGNWLFAFAFLGLRCQCDTSAQQDNICTWLVTFSDPLKCRAAKQDPIPIERTWKAQELQT